MTPNNDNLATPSFCKADLAKMQQHQITLQSDNHSFSEGLNKHSMELETALKKNPPSIVL